MLLASRAGWLLDIEGTTTSIEFVHDVLFPFATRHVEDFLHQTWTDGEVRRDVQALQSEYTAEPSSGEEPAPLVWDRSTAETERESVAAYVRWLMERDRKSAPLKLLQGKIWEAGYRGGELRADVYPDVPPALRRWREQGMKVAIFSSGSVHAQKLLFAHTVAGDLTPWIDGYFDTRAGAKQAPESYRRIAQALGCAPAEVVFVSDVAAELDAAAEAGLQAVLCVRPARPEAEGRRGRPTLPACVHPRVSSFDELP